MRGYGPARRRSGLRSVLGTLLAAASMLGVVGCGAPAASGTPTNATGASSSPTAVLSPTPDATCRTDQLTLSIGQGGAALGHITVSYHFTNTSAQTCALTGYPQILLLDANRQPKSVQVQQATAAYTFTDQQVRTVVLPAGASAYFKLEWTDVPPSSGSCPSASYLRATPPGALSAIEIAETVQPCGDTLITSPVEPAAF